MRKIHESRIQILIITIIVFLFIIGLFFVKNIMRDKEILEDTENTVYKYHVAVISDDYSEQFWSAVFNEAETAGKSRGIYIEIFGQNLTGNYTEEELMEMAILAKVDGILLETENPKGLEEYIHRAYEQGIPVMTLLNDVMNSDRIGFVSCDNYAMGEMYGKQIYEEAESRLGESSDKKKIKVTLLLNSKGENTSINIMLSGIRKALEPLKGRVELSEVLSDDDRFDSEETVYELIVGDSIPEIIVCFGTVDTVSVYQSLVEYNKVGEATIIGYYFSEDILDGIEKGIIKSALSIDTEKMGKTAVEALYKYLETGYVSEYLSVPVELITADNAGRYRRKEN